MAFELRQELRLSQQLVMTPQLQLAIKLLQMCKMELVDVIQEEMTENPVLEEVPESEGESSEGEVEDIEEVADPGQDMINKIQEGIGSDWKDYVEGASRDSYVSFSNEREQREGFEATLTRKESLTDHLMWQLHMSGLSDEEISIGEIIIGNINQDGYLQLSLVEIARIYLLKREEEKREGRVAQFNHLNWLKLLSALQNAGRALNRIQGFDPVGVACRSLRECLLIQIGFLNEEESLPERIVKFHLSDLERRKYQIIARSLNVNIEEVVESAKVISQLEPKPGRPFSDKEPQYITPDIHVCKAGDTYSVVLNGDGLPKLRISPFYLKTIYNNSSSSTAAKEYIKDKMRSAIWLIKSIYQREKTIRKVMKSIIKFQRGFFDHGIDHLKPLVLKDVAEDINMHESTVSRVTTNKYVHTTHGIFELKYFFNVGVGSDRGEGGVASESVRNKIKEILSDEDSKKPYSDQELVEMLKENDSIRIARRTVAKYREMLGILSSSRRRKFY
ncbi:MAG: RNA polymerase factor sigma-54 [Thermodesulfobacteriota bacterium]